MARAIDLAAALTLLLVPPGAAAMAQTKPEAAEPVDGETLLAALAAMVEQMRAEMFTPGERVADWDQGGADPDAELRAAGADDHVFRIEHDEGLGVVMLTRRPIADFAPAGWRIVDTYGSSATELANPAVQFETLTPRYVLAVRANSTRRGSVDCVDPIANAVLYEVPGAPPSERDETVPLFFRIALLAGEGQTVCTRYEGTRSTFYRGRSFLPDGRALPQLDDEDERITIVPAGPIDRLLAGGDSNVTVP